MAYWVDDTFDTWPEVIRAGTAAAGLYLRCGAWIARNLTDGFVPYEVATMYGTREWASKLVEVGLWKAEEHGFRDVYYLTARDGTALNPSAEKVTKRRADAAERTRKWRENKGRKGKGKAGQTPAKPVTENERVSDTSRDASSDTSRDASPALPPSKEGKGARPRSAQGAARPPKPDDHSPPNGVEVLPHWSELPAYGTPRDPADSRRASRGAAAAREAHRTAVGARPKAAGRDATAELDAAAAELPPLVQPPEREP